MVIKTGNMPLHSAPRPCRRTILVKAPIIPAPAGPEHSAASSSSICRMGVRKNGRSSLLHVFVWKLFGGTRTFEAGTPGARARLLRRSEQGGPLLEDLTHRRVRYLLSLLLSTANVMAVVAMLCGAVLSFICTFHQHSGE